MKIGIDISAVVYGTGVSVYTKNLVKSLLFVDKKNEYILYGGSLRRKGELKGFINTLKRQSPQGRRPSRAGDLKSSVFPIPPTLSDIIWNRLCVFSIEKLVGNLDVFHSSDWAQPPSKAFKVTTIHDLVPVKYPELSVPKIVAAHTARLTRVKDVVNRVIVPSKTTADDVKEFGVESKRIRIIPEAPNPIFKPADRSEIDKLKAKYKIPGDYLLAVGVSSRKNTSRIIKAVEKISKNKDLSLVVVGHPYAQISKKKNVLFLGHVMQNEMPVLFSGAEALVYTSLYEGFGLPILEAFACKTPVVTSNIGSMKEIGGAAAVLVEPKDTQSIADGIEKALDMRERLVAKGVKRSKEFSWKKTAKQTLAVYEESRRG